MMGMRPPAEETSDERTLTVGLCIICHQRPDELTDALESTDGQSFDEVVVIDMGSEPALVPAAGITRWIRSDENHGCVAGRNTAMSAMRSDVIYHMDDDAVLRGDVDQAAVLRELFQDEALGAVAGLVVRPGGSVVSHEFPFRGSPRAIDSPRPGGYFLGGCHAVRREAWLQVGGLDGRFFYSTEEIDLAARLLRDDWDIVYDPRISIEHRPSDLGRSKPRDIAGMVWRNRLLYVRTNLPWGAAIPHALVWAAFTARDALRSGSIRPWLRGWADGLRWTVNRRPLTYAQALELHRRGGRAFW